MKRRAVTRCVKVILGLAFLIPLGAALAWPKPAEVRPARAAAPSYTKSVAPILAQACISCHRPGTAAPFSLLTYEDARRRAPQVVAVTQAHYMPPWLPAPGGVPFAGARGLTDRQRQTLAAWAAAGMPEGPKALLKSPLARSSVSAWPMGTPDVILRMQDAYAVASVAGESCRTFLLPTNLGRDVWIRALDYRASCPRVVRRAALFADLSGAARRQQAQSGGFGWSDLPGLPAPDQTRLGEWTPGSAAVTLPQGVAFRLKAGADLVLHLHTEPDGLAERERSEVGLYLAPGPKTEPATLTLGAAEMTLRVQERAVVTDSFVVPVACRIQVISPHGDMACRTVQVQAFPPAGQAAMLVQIPSFNPDWAEPLRCQTPVLLPAGTQIRAELTYDNTRQNPRNAEGALMLMEPDPGCPEESAGVQVVLTPVRTDDAARLNAAVEAKPIASASITRTGGQGHG